MRSISSAVLVAAIAGGTLGCSGSTDAAMAGLPMDYTGPGTYTIPGFPTVAFSIPSVRIEQENGGVSIYYELPADLVGQKTHVELSGTPDGTGTLQLSGDVGTSTCTVSPGQLMCDEHLTGLHGSDTTLPADDPARAAAQAFLVDPIGHLYVTLPSAALTAHPDPAAK